MRLSTLILGLLPIVACANDGWFKNSGSPYDFKNPHSSIQLVKEHAHFDIGDLNTLVTVDFWFKNHGPATEITMAFPEQADRKWVPNITEFKSTVDGQAVPVRRKVLVESEDDYEFKAVWLKDISFEAGQTRHIRVTYDQAKGGDMFGHNDFFYTFKTGLTWKGSIEELRITYDWSRVNKSSKPDVKLGSFNEKGYQPTVTGQHSAKFVLKNIHPDFNFTAMSQTGFWNVELNGVWISPEKLYNRTKRHPNDFSSSKSDSDLRITLDDVPNLFPELRYQTGNPKPIDLHEMMLLAYPDAKLERVPVSDFLWNSPGPKVHFVYLRDLVEAIGGTYRYDPKYAKVYITTPKRNQHSSCTMS